MNDTRFIPVVETFHSLQGEGHHAGRSAFFIRLAGCHVGCPWCDTKHSWPMANHTQLDVEALAAEAHQAGDAGAAFVVITGGEPLHHNLQPLTNALSYACALPLHLETSGVDFLSGRFDWVTLSPKRHHPPKREVLTRCDELKVVVLDVEDLAFAMALANDTSTTAQLLLQPVWDNKIAQAITVHYVKQHPRWRLSLQSHKWLGVR
ncbi:7-carboxy-7-deazaguanine synthase QueE [Synechococcus sp. M16CYN]|uniref:7-carboxy-7-deazaguanine synthase QueE n=1 Tax=Synechococcus sp. M16CYN TaxID=3103139 RepID=UPI00324ED2C4